MNRVPIVVGLAILGWGWTPGVAQELREGCPGCTIRVEPSVSLGDDEGLGALGQPATALRRRNGQWIVTDNMDPGRPRVFSADGTYTSLLSRPGQGPSEFAFIYAMREMPGDSIHFIDFDNARRAIRDPALRPVRTTRLPAPAFAAAFLSDGGLVIRTTPMAGRPPLVYVSPNGSRVRSLGMIRPGADPGESDLWWRSVVAVTDSTVLSAELTSYVLREWTVGGRMVRELKRSVDWVVPHADFGIQRDRTAKPAPGIRGIEVGPDGLIWVIITVPDDRWREALGLGEDLYGRLSSVVVDFDVYYDTIIEVLDPESAQVLASHRMDEELRGFAAPGVAYARGTTRAGSPIVRTWTLELVR